MKVYIVSRYDLTEEDTIIDSLRIDKSKADKRVEDKNQLSLLRPKSCPNCNEPNEPDSNCRMELTYDAHSETLESEKQKDDKLSSMEKYFIELKNEMNWIKQEMNDNLKIIDYTKRLSERMVTRLNITERPTEKELKELRKRILNQQSAITRRFEITLTDTDNNLVEIKFKLERAMLEEFELFCREHNLDFDETIQKMIDIELKKYMELRHRLE